MVDEDKIVRLLVNERTTIVAYATSIVFNRDLAEDIYQNVVVVVLRKREEIDESRDILHWILGVARVEALVAMRQRGKAPHTLDETTISLIDEGWLNRLKNRPDKTETKEALRHCLRKLTERSLNVLRLRYSDGLSGENLAEKLGVKLNTAYVTVTRVHRQLRNCMETQLAHSGRDSFRSNRD